MIDIETEHGPDLKNICQIGTPTEDDRIYIENAAYARIHEEDYAKQRAFIFMGHTECSKGSYTTFVEAAIPVKDLEFSQNVPAWNTHAWSDIFREIKRSYENSIIVGWAMDIKGFAPRMTEALEAVHREQFGGAHQVLFLMDSIEGEEYFFQNRGNRLQQKEGFYIYYARELHRVHSPQVTVELPKRDSLQTLPRTEEKVRKRYRDTVQKKSAASYVMVAAVALLVVIVGVGVMQEKIPISGFGEIISTMGQKIKGQNEPAEVLVGTELPEQDTQTATETATETVTETVTETLDLIPIEEVPVDDIKKQEDTDTGDADSETANSNAVKTSEYYEVQKGDTLTGICKKIYGTTEKIKDLADANQLENADDIREGQKLLLP
jgi:LysM repeat protein